MGTNFYFFRPLTAEEENAISVVRGMHSFPNDWRPPTPFAVPLEIKNITELTANFIQNRHRYKDVLRAPKTHGSWDSGKDYYDYWMGSGEYANHIGKRSAAGLYCWNCLVTLCPGGESKLHHAHEPFLTTCPKCGLGRSPETLNGSSVGVELGFAKTKGDVPTGVTSVASFSWAIDFRAFIVWANQHLEEVCIKDEYNRKYSVQEFLDMLKCNCPIHFHDSLGVAFS